MTCFPTLKAAVAVPDCTVKVQFNDEAAWDEALLRFICGASDLAEIWLEIFRISPITSVLLSHRNKPVIFSLTCRFNYSFSKLALASERKKSQWESSEEVQVDGWVIFRRLGSKASID